MLSPSLKADIRKLWDAFWAGGIANPLTAIEQITYLIFIKRLEDLDDRRRGDAEKARRTHRSIYDFPKIEGEPVNEKEERQKKWLGDAYRWSHIRRLPSEERFNHMRGPVFDWLKQIEGDDKERMRDAVFLIPNANLLTKSVDILDKLFISERNQDTLGDVYEHLLQEIAVAGKNGQFRTPRHIIRAMCDLVNPQFGETVCDPACGTSGFLINAYQHLLEQHTSADILQYAADGTPLNLIGDKLSPEQHDDLRRNHFYGFDFDRTMVRLGWMNMIQHGLEKPNIHYADTLGSRFNARLDPANNDLYEKFDVVLANPPFTGNIDKSDIGESLKELSTTKTELLFLELILQLLKPGGRAAVIVPEGVLFGSTRAHKTIRQKLLAETELQAVISLPGGVFQPYTGVKTSILVFTKGSQTETVWFYEVAADGESLNAKRTPEPENNDLWDMRLKFKLRHGLPAPAFVRLDEATWQAWQKLDEETRAERYLQPRFVDDETETEEGEAVALARLDDFATETLDEAKDWAATPEEVAENDHNLAAGRYKPFRLDAVDHDPPAQIIADLQAIEIRIQDGLDKLLAMVEGTE
ncbi:MAG: SAM-dependent DNA methyltransferase [Anaerolineales bacterium]|nr:SAM-dependent DNA methyltransferase [Anaerolineales bacterium]MCB8992276.1 SAM-dependent DNA methyltransferase [Ardenticatenaceae bacterium]